MEKAYPHLFASMKINIVPISGEIKTTIPPKHFNFIFKFIFPYFSESSSFFCFLMMRNH